MEVDGRDTHLRAMGALVSRLGSEARREAQREAYALSLPGVPWGDGLTPEEAWEEYGAEVLAGRPELLRAGRRALAPEGLTYFASGSNTALDLRAVAMAGEPVGVSAAELSWLAAVPGRLRGVFVDSGAFSERMQGRAITPAEWEARLEWYAVVVRALRGFEWRATGSRLCLKCPVYVVAPDCVGDQAETLQRLARHAPAVRMLAEAGARVVVPVQRGAVPMAQFWREATEVLGPGSWIAGVPTHALAATVGEARAFLQAARPAAVHFLGLGPTRTGFGGWVAAAGDAEVSCDAALKRRLEGTGNGADGGGRSIARAREEFASLPAEARSQAAIVAGVLDERGPSSQLALWGSRGGEVATGGMGVR